MTPHYYSDEFVTLYHGDCLDVLRELADCSIDAVVTDPPYGLEFMGKSWDSFKATGTSLLMHAPKDDSGRTFTNASGHMFDNAKVLPRFPSAGLPFQEWCYAWSRECLRVLKPGGHMLAFGGTRTFHRLACAVEDAGFEIRDSIAWMYGSGFPKSLDVSKAIDKAAGVEREVVGPNLRHHGGGTNNVYAQDEWTRENFAAKTMLTAPATPDAERWQGWGTALKPAFEPIVVARKPLVGTVAANVLAHGTGALNVDGCRIGDEERVNSPSGAPGANNYRLQGGDGRNVENALRYAEASKALPPTTVSGRWPANVILDESQAEVLDEQSGDVPSGIAVTRNGGGRKIFNQASDGQAAPDSGYTDVGGASRFFYTAKAASDERVRIAGTAHPTVKPLALMRWLVRLVTPPGGTVLEPFAGSGTTVEACLLEGFYCIAIEREADYLPLIVQRINRRRDPVRAVRATGGDGGLFDLLDGAS